MHETKCSKCDRLISKDDKVCECGAATPNMTFEERAKFEVEQWRAYQSRATA